MENNEILEVFYNLAVENEDWIKRTPRKNIDISNINTTTPNIIKQISKNGFSSTSNNDKKNNSDISLFRDIDNVKKCIKDQEKKSYSYFNSKDEYEFIGRLDALVRIIKENRNYYQDEREINNCLDKINKIKQRIWNPTTTVDNYENKFKSMVISSQGAHTEIQTNSVKNEENSGYNTEGKTERGIQIHIALCDIREEINQKYLNPIQKENIRKSLLSLRREIEENLEHFSKHDSIPIKLDQIENYLKKVEIPLEKPKTEQKVQEVKQIQNSSTPIEKKKEKKKVIWKFGL